MSENLYARFRAAVERRDADGAAALFSTDAVFYSPIVHKPYQGRAAIHMIISGVTQVFEDLRYTHEYTDVTDPAAGHALRFSCRIGDRSLEGVDILHGNGQELTELTVLVRPLSAANLLRDRMAALLAS